MISYYVACSADGFIADSDGGVGWLDAYSNAGEDYGYGNFFSSVDSLVMGRKTYEQVLAFGEWPYGDKPCWVFSRGVIGAAPPVRSFNGTPQEWAEQTPINERGQHVWLVGGGELAASFAASGLIDEFQLFMMPSLLGGGIAPFGSGQASFAEGPRAVQLIGRQEYANGAVLLHYRREGTR